jgi:hypothetical protein
MKEKKQKKSPGIDPRVIDDAAHEVHVHSVPVFI